MKYSSLLQFMAADILNTCSRSETLYSDVHVWHDKESGATRVSEFVCNQDAPCTIMAYIKAKASFCNQTNQEILDVWKLMLSIMYL